MREERAAVVTGASSGIGLAVARALAEDGYGSASQPAGRTRSSGSQRSSAVARSPFRRTSRTTLQSRP